MIIFVKTHLLIYFKQVINYNSYYFISPLMFRSFGLWSICHIDKYKMISFHGWSLKTDPAFISPIPWYIIEAHYWQLSESSHYLSTTEVRAIMMEWTERSPLNLFTISNRLCSFSMNGWVSEVAQSCPTLCDPVDCSSPGSSIHEILQARILEWVAISFTRGSSQPRNRTQVSCTAGRFFTNWAMREALSLFNIEINKYNISK